MGLYDFTCYDVICRNAETFRETIAWNEVDDGRSVTFAAFRDQVDRLAGGLQDSGISKGDRIGVLGKNSLEYFLVYGAAAALGAIVLPVNWRLSEEEVIFNLNDGEPRVLFVDREYQAMIRGALDRIPSVEHCRNLSGGGGFGDFNELLARGRGFREVDVFSDDGFVIIHTAAVGGRPRGALLSHNNLVFATMHLMQMMAITTTDVHLNLLPLFHVAGLTMALASFHAGAPTFNMGKFDAARAVELIEAKKISLMFDFSPILASLLEQQEKNGTDMGSLRAVVGLDTPETIESYQALSGGTFYAMYGQTETSCLATFGRYADRPGSAGKTVSAARVQLLNDNGQAVPTGEVGEIAVKGPMVFKGYWNLPDENAHTFRGGWHHTGDTARFDEDGFLWYVGRKPEKELIKPGGENVYPAEVEQVILEHPAVDETVVFGVPDPKWKEGIKAVCLIKPGEAPAPEDIIAFVGARIARYKKPQYVELVSELPRLDDGSPDRLEIKKLYGGEQV